MWYMYVSYTLLSYIKIIDDLSPCRNPYHLAKVLRDIRPPYFVIYDAEIQFVRQVEVRNVNLVA